MNSYPKIYNVGHAALTGLLDQPVQVEEKVDGSQLSFGIFDGELKMKSHTKMQEISAPDKMFSKAATTILVLGEHLHPEWTYRGEYLSKPKHNSLCYDRTPDQCIILFDVNTGEECYLDAQQRAEEATRIGLECVPILWEGKDLTFDQTMNILETVSILGGQKIEGVVIKPIGYGMFGRDGKCVMGKHVSEAFKEVHRKEWKLNNPVSKDIVLMLGEAVRTPARWEKAIQYLKETGRLENSPRDIGNLIKSVQHDIEEEETEWIAQRLLKHALPAIKRKSTAGLPEWYRKKLLEKQFSSGGNDEDL